MSRDNFGVGEEKLMSVEKIEKVAMPEQIVGQRLVRLPGGGLMLHVYRVDLERQKEALRTLLGWRNPDAKGPLYPGEKSRPTGEG